MRIEGVTIPDDKRLEVSLTEIFGIGRSRARTILEETDIDYGTKASDLSSADEKKIRTAVQGYTIEGELKREWSANIKRLKDIESYRGKRHEDQMPVRGQTTQTNARNVPDGIKTKNRKRKTMGSGKRSIEKK